jgi:exopolysaccharide biosynthesis polyprenyl glycosylphosphotransferase
MEALRILSTIEPVARPSASGDSGGAARPVLQATPFEISVRRLRRQRRSPTTLFFFTDLFAITVGLCLTYFLRFYAGLIEPAGAYDVADYLRLLPLAVGLHIVILWRVGHYRQRERAFTFRGWRRMATASLLAIGGIAVLHFFQRNTEFSRISYPMGVASVTIISGIFRLILDRYLTTLKKQRRLPTSRVLILGTGPTALGLAADVSRRGYLGLEVVGFVAESPGTGFALGQTPPANPALGKPTSNGHPALPGIVGHFGEIGELIRRHEADEVFVAQPDLPSDLLLDFMLECESIDVGVRITPTAFEASMTELTVDRIGGTVLYGLKETPLRGPWLLVKRALDIVISLIVLVVGFPLLLLIGLAVKLTSRGPMLYPQERVGLDGRLFQCLKFRSMVDGAEKEGGPVWASRNDDRVTPLGRILRRTNLDELPQFWNVLVGDMSLVGPRPERPHFVSQFEAAIPRYMMRHRVRCGITGWAQVNGLRGQTPIDQRLLYDLYYVENWSIWLDIKILVATLWATDNAY